MEFRKGQIFHLKTNPLRSFVILDVNLDDRTITYVMLMTNRTYTNYISDCVNTITNQWECYNP